MKFFIRFLPLLIVFESILSLSAFAGQQDLRINNAFISFHSSTNSFFSHLFSGPVQTLQIVEEVENLDPKEDSKIFDNLIKSEFSNIPFNRLGKSIFAFDDLRLSYHFIIFTTPLFKLFQNWKLPFCC